MNTFQVTRRAQPSLFKECVKMFPFFGLASSATAGQIDYVTSHAATFSSSLITCMTNVPVLYPYWFAVPQSLIT